jgi:endonuclease IV
MFRGALAAADEVLEPRAPFHIHFSDIQFANRNETKHLAYGDGTLRAEPLGEALATFERPATVISESPDAASDDAIYAALGVRSASRASSSAASSSRSRSRRN